MCRVHLEYEAVLLVDMPAWDATAGRIPILWTNAVEGDGVRKYEFVRFSTWYGR